MTEPALMDRQQTAEFLDTSATTVWRMTAAGKLPGYRTLLTQGKWSRVVLEAWILHGCPEDAEGFEMRLRFTAVQGSSTTDQFNTTTSD